MLTNEEKTRYSKQIILPEIGISGQEKLQSASVLVIGAGGLGCPVLQYLTAAGMGTIGIADGDVVDLSNLQRQVLYTTADLGNSKASTAAAKLRDLNPHVTFQVHPEFISNANVLDILYNYDIIVDGSDNFATRYLVSDACVLLNKPMVSGAIYKFEGQVSVFNYLGGPTYRCLFPEPPGAGESPNCADIGVVATLPGIVGTIQANEVIKMITGTGTVLSGKLLVIDTLTMQTDMFSFAANPANKNKTSLPEEPEKTCKVPVTQITYTDLLKMSANASTVHIVDVREAEEHAISNIGGINVPLSVLEKRYSDLNPAFDIVVYCASGIRSMHAARMLSEKGFAKVFNLTGGIGQLTL